MRSRTGNRVELNSRSIQTAISVTLLAFAYGAFMLYPWGTDAAGYWSVFQGPLYDAPWQSTTAVSFVYPPPAAMLLAPFTLLPFGLFYALITLASMAALVYLVGWRWAGFAAVLYFPAMRDLLNGNIHILLAAALVAGAWPALLLTKVTPGIGLLNPLLRREWRTLAMTAAVTAGLCLASIVFLGADAWVRWFALLRDGMGNTGQGQSILLPVPFLVRLPFAVALCAASVRWRWLLAPGVMLALPGVFWASPALLLAIPRLRA